MPRYFSDDPLGDINAQRNTADQGLTRGLVDDINGINADSMGVQARQQAIMRRQLRFLSDRNDLFAQEGQQYSRLPQNQSPVLDLVTGNARQLAQDNARRDYLAQAQAGSGQLNAGYGDAYEANRVADVRRHDSFEQQAIEDGQRFAERQNSTHVNYQTRPQAESNIYAPQTQPSGYWTPVGYTNQRPATLDMVLPPANLKPSYDPEDPNPTGLYNGASGMVPANILRRQRPEYRLAQGLTFGAGRGFSAAY